MQNDWQPTLTGDLVILRPMREEDFEDLYAVASDPLIWKEHPEPERYQRDRFTMLFQTGMESKGAFVIIDKAINKIIGSTRFGNYAPEKSRVRIGYTFYARSHWQKGFNREAKKLMLDYAFERVNTVHFHVGENNQRSRTAMGKLGAVLVGSEQHPQLDGKVITSVIFEITKDAYLRRPPPEL